MPQIHQCEYLQNSLLWIMRLKMPLVRYMGFNSLVSLKSNMLWVQWIMLTLIWLPRSILNSLIRCPCKSMIFSKGIDIVLQHYSMKILLGKCKDRNLLLKCQSNCTNSSQHHYNTSSQSYQECKRMHLRKILQQHCQNACKLRIWQAHNSLLVFCSTTKLHTLKHNNQLN